MARRMILACSIGLGLVVAPLDFVRAEPTPDVYVQLPILRGGAVPEETDFVIRAQNVGLQPTRIALLVWGAYTGFCAPQDPGPMKLECSGLVQPGASWSWTSASLPARATSAVAFSYQDGFPVNGTAGNPTASCGYFSAQVAHAWPTEWDFYQLHAGGGAFPFEYFQPSPFGGQPIAVEVVRTIQTPADPALTASGSYSAVGAADEATFDALSSAFAYTVPGVKAAFSGMDTKLYIQNSGDACTAVDLAFQQQDDCFHEQLGTVAQLAPGESVVVNASSVVGPGFIGRLAVRSSQPLGIVADHLGGQFLLTTTQSPGPHTVMGSNPASSTPPGAPVLYGPLTYRETTGWDTKVYVENLSTITAAQVNVVAMDAAGTPLDLLSEFICPGSMGTFFFPMSGDLGGLAVGSIRVESQSLIAPSGALLPPAPVAGVVELVRRDLEEAVSYTLVPQHQAFEWPTGAHKKLNVLRLAVPGFHKRSPLALTSELAIQDVNPNPGSTILGLYVFDQNGFVGRVCLEVDDDQVVYLDTDAWDFLPPGFVGSAIVQANPKASTQRARNRRRVVVGLAGVNVERHGTVLGVPIPGDEAAATNVFPLTARGALDVKRLGLPLCTFADVP